MSETCDRVKNQEVAILHCPAVSTELYSKGRDGGGVGGPPEKLCILVLTA